MNGIHTSLNRRMLFGCSLAACIFKTLFANAQTSPPNFDIIGNLHITGAIKSFSIDVYMNVTNEDPLTGNFSAIENTGDNVTGTVSGSNITFYVSDFFGGGYFSGTISTNGMAGGMYENDSGGRWNGFWNVATQQPFQIYSAPVFTLQPITVVSAPGSNVTFSALAAGNPSVAYQWTFNGNPIPGATNTSYPLISSLANVGYYSVLASNSLGTNASTNASLSLFSIQCAPMIVLYGSIGQDFQIFESPTPNRENSTLVTNVVLTSVPFVWTDTNSISKASGFFWAKPIN